MYEKLGKWLTHSVVKISKKPYFIGFSIKPSSQHEGGVENLVEDHKKCSISRQ